MLRNLVRKELILNRNTLLLTALPYVGWFAYLLREIRTGAGEYLVMSAVMAVFYQVVVFVREDKLKTAALTCSLPLTRARIVRSRYGIGASLVALWIAIAILLALVCPWSHLAADRVLAPKTLGVALSVGVLGTAILFPLVIRLGLIGVVAFLGVIQVFGLATFLVMDLFGATGATRAVFGSIEETVRALYRHLGDSGFAVTWAIALAIVTFASYRASVFLYERRDF
jgi:hypothetical protein